MDDRLMVMTNADHILLYCDEKLIGEFYPDETVFRDLVHPPIFVEHLSEIVRTGEKPKRTETERNVKQSLFEKRIREGSRAVCSTEIRAGIFQKIRGDMAH